MLVHLITSILLLSTAIALPTELPECSRTSSQPCKCPSGTVYHTCTTYSTVGANAFDVRNLTGDCTPLPPCYIYTNQPAPLPAPLEFHVGLQTGQGELNNWQSMTSAGFLKPFKTNMDQTIPLAPPVPPSSAQMLAFTHGLRR